MTKHMQCYNFVIQDLYPAQSTTSIFLKRRKEKHVVDSVMASSNRTQCSQFDRLGSREAEKYKMIIIE